MKHADKLQFLAERRALLQKIKRELEAKLPKAGFKIKRILVAGGVITIDTLRKHEKALAEIMTQAGFTCIYADKIMHLDGYKGFRMRFRI